MTNPHKQSAEEYSHNEDLATTLMIRNTKDLDHALHYLREAMQSFAKQEVKNAEDIINRLKYGMKTNGCSTDYINLVIKTPVHIQKKVKANIEKNLKKPKI